MVAPDNDPSNDNQYSGYDDPTGTPTPRNSHGEAMGVQHMRQVDYEALDSTEVQGDVVYVTTGESGVE